jgi:branched-subunit amino acid aminotransferase/4-amino-4-deoxychorismate lyase
MNVPLAYLNGRYLPQTEASLTLHDAGFVMGATVTDFCRTFNRVLFRWPDHLARFRRDCDACFVQLPTADTELTSIAEELVRHNAALLGPGQELSLISFATPGPIGYYLGEPGGAGDGSPTLGLHTFPLPFERYRRFFAEGVALSPLGYQPSVDDIFPARVKHRSRIHWWLADRAIRAHPKDHPAHALPILVDSFTNTLTETAIGNLLVVRGNVLRSPPPELILDGISLRVVRELAAQLGVAFEQGPIALTDMLHADEAMLCGTAFCLSGVSNFDKRTIPWPGPMFTRLLAAWSERVGLDIARQILPNP